jgi:two-component system CheB/CheR fusion protein
MKYVSSSSQNLLFLIDEILEHSRLESGEVKVCLAPADIVALCYELLDSYRNINRKSGRTEIPLILEIDPSINALVVNTDIQRLRQVLSNLINNAFKYTRKGSVTFGFVLNGQELEFFVRDTGIGVSGADLSEIFNRFKRAGNQFESGTTGTGIGLSISKNLVELLGGKIWAESELGKGSVFRFTLPIQPAVMDPDPKPRLVDAELPGDMDWASKTILIAEDEELNYLFLKECLRITGIGTLWAKTGREAIELVSAHPEIDLVLMDIRMPDIDGYQATRLIKTQRPELPLIIQTAYAFSDEKSRSKKEGSDEFITKPINRLLLLKTMSIYLNR